MVNTGNPYTVQPVPDPITQPDSYNHIQIAGIDSPGACVVSEFKRHADWDQKRGKGVFGATLTYTGKPLARGTIKFFLWLPEHWTQWNSFRQLFKYDPAKKVLDFAKVYHPSLAEINVNQLVCEDIGNSVHLGNLLYSITCAFIEYSPPPPTSAVSTPASAQKSNPGGIPPAAGTPPLTTTETNNIEIGSLLRQRNNLAGNYLNTSDAGGGGSSF